jgi:hypothetical protein
MQKIYSRENEIPRSDKLKSVQMARKPNEDELAKLQIA